MNQILWADYETRSHCPLKSKGAYNYAQDLLTEIICLSVAFDDEEVQTWLPSQGRTELLDRIDQHIKAGGMIYAHNAAFDRLITEFILCPDFKVSQPKLEQWYCTATQARANCAPGGLEDVGRFAGAGMKKDYRGGELIRKMSIPPFEESPELLAEMVAYCEQDIRAMRAVSQALRPLSEDELADYHLNERINDRGVLVDVPLARAAAAYANQESIDIQTRIADITDGEIDTIRSPRMRAWVMERIGVEALELMVVYKDGEKKYSIDKSIRANLLAMADENPEQVPPLVADVIRGADDLWSSSTAKFSRMASLADDEDHRVRGAFVFAGGAATGRASSYGIQAHNLPRMCAKHPAQVRTDMLAGRPLVPTHGVRVSDILKGMLRPSFMPSDGNVFVVYDWSAIEGRVHPWLANSWDGEIKLDVFRQGLDPYKVNAAAMFRVGYGEVTKEQRTIGKVQELALGFLGGAGAFAVFGKVYGMQFDEIEARKAVKAWRSANPWAMAHGQGLENAYTRAMRNRGHEFSSARITYMFDGQHLWYALPSGRVLCYPHARLEEKGVSYAKAAYKPAADAKEWPRANLWPGLAVENATQATANDILRLSLRRLYAEGLDVVLHIHDEIVVECREDDAESVSRLMHKVMCEPPAWAEGLPLAAEGSVMSRYGK